MPTTPIAPMPDCVPVVLAAAGLALAPAGAFGQGDPLSEPFPPVIDLTTLDGVTGFRLDGARPGDRSGFSVSGAADINGDGIGDLIIGAPFADLPSRESAGMVYLVFGRDRSSGGAFPAVFDLASVDGTNGLRLHGADRFDQCGWSVASAGDLNGDGIGDALFGAWRADAYGSNDAGKTYVLFGRNTATAGGFPAELELFLLSGDTGMHLLGVSPLDQSGRCVAPAGDVNGDGMDDILIGGRRVEYSYRDPIPGPSYVIFGRDAASGGLPSTLRLSDLDGTTGFRFDGIQRRYAYGDRSVNSAGDVNGDGVDDAIFGACGAGPGGRFDAGSSYVVFGRGTPGGGGFPARLGPSDLDGMNGFQLDGVEPSDYSGTSVSSAGDINGDGVDDILVGAIEAGDEGRCYVVFGRDHATGGSFPAVLDLSDLDGVSGFRIDGPDGLTGWSVALAGDVNDDGMDDIIIGSPGGEGSAFVVFGRDAVTGGRFPAILPLAELDGSTGFRLNGMGGPGSIGSAVASAGDVNGDGVQDIIIGSSSANPYGRGGAGSTYVVFGRHRDSCRPDLDRDGALTIFDFLAFGNLFDLMDPIADFDGDGSLTIFDFLAFQTAFDAGCP